MSFYDDEEPTQAHSTGDRDSRRSAPQPDAQQTVMTRRLVAVGIGLVVLLALIIGVKSCADSRTTSQLKEFNRKASQLITQSDSQVSGPFFKQITGASSKAPTDLQEKVNQLVLLAEDQVKQAKNLDAPDSLGSAKTNLVLSMELRREALSMIAHDLQTAVSRNAADSKNAVNSIAGQMRLFDAADVIYSVRVKNAINSAFDDDGIAVGTGGEQISESTFLPSWKWLDPQYVSSQLTGTGSDSQAATPGTHGHSLESVSAGGQTLSPDVTNTVPGPSPAFAVTFRNGGTVDEANVKITVKVEGGPTPIIAEKVVPQTKAGQTQTIQVPLATGVATGEAKVTVTIGNVPGETKTDNNSSTYPVTFT